MCTKAPKAPTPTEADKPAVLLTARDGMGAATDSGADGRKKFRIDLNNASNSTPYGSSLVIPT